jgi:hypothetical protein
MALREFQLLQENVNIGRVRLAPSAISFGPYGPSTSSHTWLLTRNENRTLRMHNTVTGHFKDVRASDVLYAQEDDRAPSDGLRHIEVVLRYRLGLQSCRAQWLTDDEQHWPPAV